MTNVICPNCDSENAEFVDGSRCYSCGTPLKHQVGGFVETPPDLDDEEDDIFCHTCESQPHEEVVMITKGRMNGINFEEDVDARVYYCNDCWNELAKNAETIQEIFEEDE